MRSLIAAVLALSLIGPTSWAQGEAPGLLLLIFSFGQ